MIRREQEGELVTEANLVILAHLVTCGHLGQVSTACLLGMLRQQEKSGGGLGKFQIYSRDGERAGENVKERERLKLL